MMTTISTQAGLVGRWWRALRMNRTGDDLDLGMWLVTVPAVGLGAISGLAMGLADRASWLNRVGTFLLMVAIATSCATVVMVIVQRRSRRGRTSHFLLSCWWIAAGEAVWLPIGWVAAAVGGGAAGVLVRLVVRHTTADRLSITSRDAERLESPGSLRGLASWVLFLTDDLE